MPASSVLRGARIVAKVTRVLIVDDEPNIRHTVGYNLRREGYEVLEAADGEAACWPPRASSRSTSWCST